MKESIKNKKGFTFIELIVSVSIFMLITGMMLANFRSGNQSNDLSNSAEIIANKLREAQTQSLSGVGAVGTTGNGVYLQNGHSSFVTYDDDRDGSNDLAYDAAEAGLVSGLLKNVTISTNADILFALPSGDLYESGTLQTDTVTVTVTHTTSGLRRDITIVAISGQVSVSDAY